MAEALIARLAKGINLGVINPEDDGHKRRVVETLLQGIEAKTIGDGRDRRVELWFRWLAQEPSGLADPQEVYNTLFDEEGNAGEWTTSGVLSSRLSAVLSDATTFPNS
jgi:hypothetical protein